MIEGFVVGILVIVIALSIMFIYACIKMSSEVENDNQPSKDRKTKADK